MTNPCNSPYAKARNDVLGTIKALPPHLQTMLMQELNLYFRVTNDEHAQDASGRSQRIHLSAQW